MGLSPPIMSDIFSLSENSFYNLRCSVTVNRRNIRTRKFGFETVSTIGAILWNDLPPELKNAESLKIFKQKIKLWSPNDCPRKTYIHTCIHTYIHTYINTYIHTCRHAIFD